MGLVVWSNMTESESECGAFLKCLTGVTSIQGSDGLSCPIWKYKKAIYRCLLPIQ